MAGIGTIQEIVNDFYDSTAREMRIVSRRVLRELRSSPPIGTPVDTGRARAAWFPCIGSPSDAIPEVAGEYDSVLNTYKTSMGNIYIVNNQPYINRLNTGWSKQSPGGFVEAAMQTAIESRRGSLLGRLYGNIMDLFGR